jgi:hypothetical protein
MAKAAIKLHFFTDANVPDQVGVYLRGRGHSVHVLRKHMPQDAPDSVVGMAALQAGRILVTQDKDFNSQRFMKDKFAGLSRLSLVGPGATLRDAVREHMHLIEAQWAHKVQTGAPRMIVHIQVGQIKFRA